MLHQEDMKMTLVEILTKSPKISEKQHHFIPSNYEELRQTAALKEYLAEKEKLTDLLIDNQHEITELKSAFTTLCKQRDARNINTALHFLAMPESFCNRLYWDLAIQLFAPKHLGEIIAILMPNVVAFLTMDFYRNSGEPSKSMTRVQLKLRTQALTALETYPPRLAMLTKCIIEDQLIFPIKQMAKLPFHFQQKLYAQLDQYPAIKKKLYSHNADLQKAAFNIELIEQKGKTLKEMITQFATELRRSGQRFTGNLYAADAVAVSISNFLTYLESLPSTLRNTIEFLENNTNTINLNKVLYNLGQGECVETSADTLDAIRDNPTNSAIMEQHPALSNDYHKIIHPYGRTKLEMQGYDTTTRLPDALRRQIIQNIKITSLYDYIDLLLNLPTEEYQTILEHAVITCVPPLPDNLADNMTMFTPEQSIALLDAVLQHRHRLGGIEAVTKLATSIFKNITDLNASAPHEKVKNQLLRLIETEVDFSHYRVAMEFILTVCQQNEIEDKLATFPILERIQFAIDYNVVNIIKTFFNSGLAMIVPLQQQETFLFSALTKGHIEIAEYLLCHGFAFNQLNFYSHFRHSSDVFVNDFQRSAILRAKFIELFVNEYEDIARCSRQTPMLNFFEKVATPEEMNTLFAALPVFDQALLSIKHNRLDILQQLVDRGVLANFEKFQKNRLLSTALQWNRLIAEWLVKNGFVFDEKRLSDYLRDSIFDQIISSSILAASLLNALIDLYARDKFIGISDKLQKLLEYGQLRIIPLRIPIEAKCRLSIKAGDLTNLKQHIRLLSVDTLQRIKSTLLCDAIINSQLEIVLYLLQMGAQLDNAAMIAVSKSLNEHLRSMILSHPTISNQIRNDIIFWISTTPAWELDNVVHLGYCLTQDDPKTFNAMLLLIPAPYNLLIANRYGCTEVVSKLVETYAGSHPIHLTDILERAVTADHSFLLETLLNAGVHISSILKDQYFPYIERCSRVTKTCLRAIRVQRHTFSHYASEMALSWYQQLSTSNAFEKFIRSLPDPEQIYYACKYGLTNVISQFASQPELLDSPGHAGYLPLQVAINYDQYEVASVLLQHGVNCYQLAYYTASTSAKIKQGFEQHPPFRDAFMTMAINQVDKIIRSTPTIIYIKEATLPDEFRFFLAKLPPYQHLNYALVTNLVDEIETFDRYADIENLNDPANHNLFELTISKQAYMVAVKLLQVNDDISYFLAIEQKKLMQYLGKIKQHRLLARSIVDAIDKHLTNIIMTPIIVDFYYQCVGEIRFSAFILRLRPEEQFYYGCCHNMLNLVDQYITKTEIISKIDSGFTSPLVAAMQQNHEAVVQRLLLQNLCINQPTYYLKETTRGIYKANVSPLVYALKIKRADYAEQLLQRGATFTQDALMQAISDNNVEIVKLMLEQTSTHDHLRANNKSLLAWAVLHKQHAIITILLKRFKPENIYDKDQLLTPVYWAVKQGDLTVVKQLLAYNVPIGPMGYNILTETPDPKIRVLLKLALLIADHNANNEYQGLGNVWQQTLTSSNFFNQTQRFANTNLNSAVNLLNDLVASEAITLKKPNKTIFAENSSLQAIYREAKLAFKA